MKKIYMLGCALLLQLSGNLFAQAPYCAMSAANGGLSTTYYIANFSTTGGGTNISNLGTTCGAGNYEDRTAMIASQFAGGPAVNFEVDFGPSSFATFGIGIWIDWNENDTFDPSEQVFQSSGYESYYSGGISVPLGTPVGTYRMRVLADYNSQVPSNPCSLNFGQGEAEDYTFEVTASPSCMPVADVLIDGVTVNSIDISWTSQGTETDWNIEYGPQGFTQGAGTPGTSTTASFTAGLLTANSYYDFYVQADCGGGDESLWIGPITGYTGYCEFESFDSYNYIDNFSTTGGSTSNISNLGSGYGLDGYEDATSMVVSSFEGGPDINFTADLSDYHGISIWVDWNGNLIFEPSEQMYTGGYYDETFSGSFGVPLGVAVGTYRMRVLMDYDNGSPSDPCNTEYGYGEVEDYTFEVVPIPTCLPVTDLQIDGETVNSLDISWTAGDSETAWNIEWGVQGFVPGTGAGIDSDQTTTESFTVPGLDHSTTYDVYVQASCSSTDSSFWTLVSGTTLCGVISNFPWTENFDAMTAVDYDLFPPCWVSEFGDWYTDDASNNISYNSVPYSGDNYLGIYYDGDDYIATPEFQLTAGRVYEFSFMWAGDNYDGWNGEVFVNDQQSSSNATSLGVFVESFDITSSTTFKKETFCFTPTVSGAYSFGIYAYSNGNPWNLAFDDFSVVQRQPGAGTNGSLTVCQVSGLVDLNDIVVKDDQNGMWVFDQNSSAIVNDSMFNPAFVLAGTVNVNYVTLGCLEDTATATITIFPRSNAGTDGQLTVCKNEPLILLNALTGTVDLGGNWYNSQNILLSNNVVTLAPNFPGQYNYKYIVGNSVCPNDTSSVVVAVGTCDWLSVDEIALDEMSLYPNPSNGLVFIESNFADGSFNLEIMDINGRVVESGNNTISLGTNTVNLSHVQRGTYFFKLSNDNAERVYRVVIQ